MGPIWRVFPFQRERTVTKEVSLGSLWIKNYIYSVSQPFKTTNRMTLIPLNLFLDQDGKEILAYFYGPMGFLCVANTLFISHTGLRLYFTDKKCDCLFGSCRRDDHSLYRTHMTEWVQASVCFSTCLLNS